MFGVRAVSIRAHRKLLLGKPICHFYVKKERAHIFPMVLSAPETGFPLSSLAAEVPEVVIVVVCFGSDFCF